MYFLLISFDCLQNNQARFDEGQLKCESLIIIRFTRHSIHDHDSLFIQLEKEVLYRRCRFVIW